MSRRNPRERLIEALLLERFGPPKRITSEQPKLTPVAQIEVCGGCGRFANADRPCPECAKRRTEKRTA